MPSMRRREFVTLLGGAAAAWPLSAHAQQPAMPVVGLLAGKSQDGYADRLRGFRQGMKDAGYIEGENVAIEYSWANGHIDRLPILAAELIRRRVAVIAALGSANSAVAAKAATTTTPIVFLVGEDPVRLGLVASVARPGGNLTGINLFNSELISKRLELLRMLVPTAARVAVLVNPTDRVNAETVVRDLDPSARSIGVEIQTFRPAPVAKSMPLSRPLCTHSRTRCLSPAKLISTVGASSWSTLRRTTVSPRLMARGPIPTSAG